MKKLYFILIIIVISLNTNAQGFFASLWQGNVEVVKNHVNENPDCINKILNYDLTPFQIVSVWGQNNQEEILKFLLEKGTDINFKNPKGRTALHYAAESAEIFTIEFLLKNGADKTIIDNDGQAPLYFAVIRAEKKVIDLLYDQDLVFPKDIKKKNNLLLKAATSGHEIITNQLIKEGADIKTLRGDNGNILHCSAEGNLYKLMIKFIKKGFDINSKNSYFYTPLHLAVLNNNIESVKTLIKLGSDINIKDNLGKTPYYFASKLKHSKIAALLKKSGANINLKPYEIKDMYFGMKVPGDVPEIFAPGLVSTMKGFEFAGVFTPDNKEFFFTQRGLGFGQRIRYYQQEKGEWSTVDFAPFTYNCFEYEPFATLDGKKLYYGSRRPLPGDTVINSHSDIWVVEKNSTEWGEPKHVGTGMMFVTLSENGTLYTTDLSEKRLGLIKREFKNGEFQEAISLGDSVNFMPSTFHPFIAPDESFVIFDAQPKGFEAGAKMFISFKKQDGSWTKAKPLPDVINKGELMCVSLSPDGKYMFFHRNQDGYGDIYWVSTRFIDKMKKRY